MFHPPLPPPLSLGTYANNAARYYSSAARTASFEEFQTHGTRPGAREMFIAACKSATNETSVMPSPWRSLLVETVKRIWNVARCTKPKPRGHEIRGSFAYLFAELAVASSFRDCSRVDQQPKPHRCSSLTFVPGLFSFFLNALARDPRCSRVSSFMSLTVYFCSVFG